MGQWLSLSDRELFLLLTEIESLVQVSGQSMDWEEAVSSLLVLGGERPGRKAVWVWPRAPGVSCWPLALLVLPRLRPQFPPR